MYDINNAEERSFDIILNEIKREHKQMRSARVVLSSE